jgi:hyperosmotically inducible periplasmic protein
MKFQKSSQTSAIVLALALSASWVAPSRAQSATSQVQPDNTKVNKRDKNPDEATADQQKMNAADRNLTAKIRKSVMADKTLSTYAHNVKIISQNGIVTLKGPVHSADEVKSIMAKAVDVAGGPDKVVNQMSVKP